ncbi:PREDICTED: 39S ribosomal protein L45, mitochondrial [Ipomoea nil]|uniref:39S ribosomal protein L45, mitochondrial n=1 Tax=Ipomoea nil TaxID=35883 RepID=UPI000900ABDE|nr:PREDICTED: 39S ribosomal protein L45, mitochondrial [Ipomoea nil]
MALRRLTSVRNLQRCLYRATEIRSVSSSLLNSSSRNSPDIFCDTECWPNSSCLFKPHDSSSWNNRFTHVSSWNTISRLYNDTSSLPWTSGGPVLRSTIEPKPTNFGYQRSVTVQAKAPPQARQMAAVKVSMLSPGIVFEPYATRESMPFWKRWFTRTGWRRIKEEITSELKSAYAIAKLRKTGYSKQKFYEEALELYKEINTHIANGDKAPLRKSVTEKMYSALKNEIRQRESVWSHVYWELVEPVVKIRTLRARMIGVDRDDLSKLFIQLTLEIVTKQKFEAYNSNGAVIAGNKNKEVTVREIWVFEKSLFHKGACWRLCGRIKP